MEIPSIERLQILPPNYENLPLENVLGKTSHEKHRFLQVFLKPLSTWVLIFLIMVCILAVFARCGLVLARRQTTAWKIVNTWHLLR